MSEDQDILGKNNAKYHRSGVAHPQVTNGLGLENPPPFWVTSYKMGPEPIDRYKMEFTHSEKNGRNCLNRVISLPFNGVISILWDP